MKKHCINCHFADTVNADKEYASIAEMAEMMDDDDYLICTHTFNIVSARNMNKDSGHSLKIEAFRVDDYNTCGLWKKCKDAKMIFIGDTRNA